VSFANVAGSSPVKLLEEIFLYIQLKNKTANYDSKPYKSRWTLYIGLLYFEG